MALQILLCALAAGGIIGFLLELKAPGLIVPGIAGLVCLVAFFWIQAGAGAIVALASGLFVLGALLIVAEVAFIPGHGVAAAFGLVLALAGLALAGADSAPNTAEEWTELGGRFVRYGLAAAAAWVGACYLAHHLPNVPYANRLVLVPPEDEVAEPDAVLLGRVGTTTSDLRPGGKADFGGRLAHVVAEWDFIALGERVQVVELDGPRVVVRSVRT